MRSNLIALVIALGACGTSRPQVARDASPDSVVDPCDRCTADQLCVQKYDGTCVLDTSCVTPAATCPHPVLNEQPCSQQCNDAYCPSPYQCLTRIGCTGKPPSPKAFTCYGP